MAQQRGMKRAAKVLVRKQKKEFKPKQQTSVASKDWAKYLPKKKQRLKARERVSYSLKHFETVLCRAVFCYMCCPPNENTMPLTMTSLPCAAPC